MQRMEYDVKSAQKNVEGMMVQMSEIKVDTTKLEKSLQDMSRSFKDMTRILKVMNENLVEHMRRANASLEHQNEVKPTSMKNIMSRVNDRDAY